ncbi:MAG: HAD family hydrolase [Candidatus Bathyarchaeota archaeon]|nr:HAD family hydrolase [Candidatus Bathyarchaeota archaeon]
MAVKAVIFDLDGTIVAFSLDYKALRADVRAYLRSKAVPDSLLSVNDTLFEMLKKTELFLKNSGKTPEALQKTVAGALSIAESYELDAAKQTSLLPGALDTLKTLKNKDLKTAICTLSSQKAVNYMITRFKLAAYFDVVVPREKTVQVKPDAEHLKAALTAMDVLANEAVVVGDSIEDMQAAKELNAIAVGFPTGVATQKQLTRNGANYIITSITDLPLLIDNLNKPSPT